MVFSARAARKNKTTPCTDDNELNSIKSPKRQKMQTSTPTNKGPCIKIEQLVKHDVWDISRKDDGAFVMKKLTGDGAGTPANASAVNRNAGTRTNAEQTGARPKVIIEVPERNNAAQHVNSVISGNTGTAKPMNASRVEVVLPQKNVITLTPINTARNSVISINSTSAQPKGIITMKTTAPEKGVLTLNVVPAPKKDVATINVAPSQKKEVITINTAPSTKPAVFTLNTSTGKDEELGANKVNDSARKHTMHNNWDVTKEEASLSAASTSNISSGQSASGSQSGSDVRSKSFPIYSEEVYQLQDMFPQMPLTVIADHLKISGSLEGAIDSLLAAPFAAPVPPSNVPPAASSDDDVVYIQSVKADKPKTDNVPSSSKKKGGSSIKIEILPQNQVWDITRRKDKEGFVMKKVTEDGKADIAEDVGTEHQYNRPDDSFSQADDSVEVIEEHDPVLDDILLDGMSHVGNIEQSNTPVKLLVYSQSSDNTIPDSKRKVTSHDEENLDSAMEVDSFDYSTGPQRKISVEAFEFSDDENESDETIEYFLFKASLILRKLKYKNQSEIETLEKRALLNITGGTKNEEAEEVVDAAEEVVDTSEMSSDDSDDSEEYYSDERCTDQD